MFIMNTCICKSREISVLRKTITKKKKKSVLNNGLCLKLKWIWSSFFILAMEFLVVLFQHLYISSLNVNLPLLDNSFIFLHGTKLLSLSQNRQHMRWSSSETEIRTASWIAFFFTVGCHFRDRHPMAMKS